MELGDAVHAVHAARSAEGRFWSGTPLDAVSTAGPVLVALAAWSRPGRRVRVAAHSTAAVSVPVLATLAAVVVLADRDPGLPAVAVHLSAAVVVVSVVRRL